MKKAPSRAALLALAVCAAAAHAADGKSLDAVLSQMDEAAAGFKSMSAKVRRVAHTAVINDDNVDSGTILLKRPKPRDMRMLVDLTEPDPKAVAFQGRKIEMYYPKISTVQEIDVGKNKDAMEQFLLLGFGTSGKELSSGYSIRMLGAETIAGQKAARLELTPKAKEVQQHLKKVELWVSDTTGYPVQQKFHTGGGDYTLVTYSGVKINPDLSDAALKLKLPRNTKREVLQK